MPRPSASIVIRAKNEEADIGDVLAKIAAQTRVDHEVVLVDSGSTDRTLEIARGFDVRLVEIPPEDFTFGYALNVGGEASRGRYLICLSAHSVPLDERWLDRLIAPMEEHADCAGTYGRQVGRHDINTFEAIALEGAYGDEPKVQHEEPMFANANSAVRRELWRECPFDEQVKGTEDWLWAAEQQRRGRHVRYVPDAAVWHFHDEDLWPLVRRKFNEARAAPELLPPRTPRFWRLAAGPMQLGIPLFTLNRMRTRRIAPSQLPRGLAWYYASWWGHFLAYQLRDLDRLRGD
jgi:glycosyltransferase involved in cell wall biosynthesis